MMRDQRVPFAVSWIDLANLFEPRVGRAVGQNFDGRVDGHGIERLGRNLQRFVRLRKSFVFVGVLQQQIGHQFVGFDEFRIEFQSPSRYIQRPCCRIRRRSPARGRNRLARSSGLFPKLP